MHEEWCHLLKTAMDDYKHEKSLGHQVKGYYTLINTYGTINILIRLSSKQNDTALSELMSVNLIICLYRGSALRRAILVI